MRFFNRLPTLPKDIIGFDHDAHRYSCVCLVEDCGYSVPTGGYTLRDHSDRSHPYTITYCRGDHYYDGTWVRTFIVYDAANRYCSLHQENMTLQVEIPDGVFPQIDTSSR